MWVMHSSKTLPRIPKLRSAMINTHIEHRKITAKLGQGAEFWCRQSKFFHAHEFF